MTLFGFELGVTQKISPIVLWLAFNPNRLCLPKSLYNAFELVIAAIFNKKFGIRERVILLNDQTRARDSSKFLVAGFGT